MATIALPIEIKVRELDGYLWLAAHLAQHGHRVAIGDRSGMDVFNEIRPDVYVANSLVYTDSKRNFFEKLNQYECHLVILDSEGGVFSSVESYYERRISERLLPYINLMCAWGVKQAEVIRERTVLSEEILHVSGHPRFDLLHKNLREIYSQSVNDLQSRLGEYILVNTNFTAVNNFADSVSKRILEKREIEHAENREEYQSVLIELFKKGINQISTVDEIDTVVVRPHPSEDHAYYESEFAGNSSVVVEHSGDVIPWIMGARIVLHNACTTGIESAMLNTPVIAFEPETDFEATGRSHLPNFVSKSVSFVDELLDSVQEYLNSSEPYLMSTEQQAELEQYFANVKEPAAPKIVDAIDESLPERPETTYPTLSLERQVKLWIKRQPIAPTVQRLRGVKSVKSDYGKQKFPGLEIEEVRSRLEDLEGIIDTSDIRVQRLNYLDDVYWLYK